MRWASAAMTSREKFSFRVNGANPDIPDWLQEEHYIGTKPLVDWVASLSANVVEIGFNHEINEEESRVEEAVFSTPEGDRIVTPDWSNIDHLAGLAKDANLGPVFYPTIVRENWEGSMLWPPYSPDDPGAWFDSYEPIILRTAELAQKYQSPYMPLGVELGNVAQNAALEEKWSDLIVKIRDTYEGPLTYNTFLNDWYAESFSDTVNELVFIDRLDYVVINLYPELLSSPAEPLVRGGTLDDFRAAWLEGLDNRPPLVDVIRNEVEQVDKPVFLSEFGLERFDGAGSQHLSDDKSLPLDLTEQAEAYQASFEAIVNELSDVILGLNTWATTDSSVINEEGRLTRVSSTEFNIFGNPAEDVVREVYEALQLGSVQDDVLTGSDAADTLDGLSGDDTITGAGGGDQLWGGFGDDTLEAEAGGNLLDGGPGVDTVVYTRIMRSEALVEAAGGAEITVGLENATDELKGVERIRFQDGALAFDTQGTAGQAYRVYEAAFDRRPDTPGLSYWIRQMDDGMSQRELANRFLESDEFREIYGKTRARRDLLKHFT